MGRASREKRERRNAREEMPQPPQARFAPLPGLDEELTAAIDARAPHGLTSVELWLGRDKIGGDQRLLGRVQVQEASSLADAVLESVAAVFTAKDVGDETLKAMMRRGIAVSTPESAGLHMLLGDVLPGEPDEGMSWTEALRRRIDDALVLLDTPTPILDTHMASIAAMDKAGPAPSGKH